MLQRESNADETLSVNTEENINTNEEGVLPSQIATQFMQYIPVHR
jgi:hypothetical protein